MAQQDIAQIASFIGAVVLLVPPLWKLLRGVQRGLDRMDALAAKVDATNEHLATLNGSVARNTSAIHSLEIDNARVIAYIEGREGKVLGELKKDIPQ